MTDPILGQPVIKALAHASLVGPTNIREQLMRDEGLRLKFYTDTLGNPSIGWGRNLGDSKGISLMEAELLLDNDILAATATVLARIPYAHTLDGARMGVLVNMAFNLGIDGLLGFKHMLADVKAGLWDAAAAQMLNSRWHEQVGVRAERLAEQMRTGEWQ